MDLRNTYTYIYFSLYIKIYEFTQIPDTSSHWFQHYWVNSRLTSFPICNSFPWLKILALLSSIYSLICSAPLWVVSLLTPWGCYLIQKTALYGSLLCRATTSVSLSCRLWPPLACLPISYGIWLLLGNWKFLKWIWKLEKSFGKSEWALHSDIVLMHIIHIFSSSHNFSSPLWMGRLFRILMLTITSVLQKQAKFS